MNAPEPLAAFEAAQAAFGPVETVRLSRIQQLGGAHLARSWTSVPHVTHHDEADITALAAARDRDADTGTRRSLLAFLLKAAVTALQAHERFNASLAPDGRTLVLKRYVHLGVAIDTPAGLLVGVVRDCDAKSLAELDAEIASLSTAARGRGLSLDQSSGGGFTISSLGGIGGGFFTPIINPPEVAILGVGRAVSRPRPDANGGIDWRQMLPLSLSYDHRVINGADAARFVATLAGALAQAGSAA